MISGRLNNPMAIWIAAGLVLTAPASEIRKDETVRAVAKVLPSVVNISGKTVVKQRGYFFDWWRENWAPFYRDLPPQYSAGSGVIIDEDGYILTNVHVVEDANEIVVTLSDKRSYPADLVIGTRKTDVALLKLRAKPGEKFTPIRFAADDDLYLGETVLALGNPFGLGESVSKGILSSKTRRSTAQDGPLEMEDWLQTDAAINPGNSGGPLVNLDAELIGLDVAIYKEGQGIGFAIPVKRISEALAEIFTPENVRSLWFGAQFKSTTNGITVTAVQPESPAQKGGLREGDIVTRVNSVVPRSVFSLNRELIRAGDRTPVEIQWTRERKPGHASVRLEPEATHFNARLIREKIGITLRQLSSEDIARLGLNIGGGFMITAIERGSPADNAGFQQGLILEAIDGVVPDSVMDAAKMLASKKRGSKTTLRLIVPGPFRRAEATLKVR
jgi:S1-C subfamily serine protease